MLHQNNNGHEPQNSEVNRDSKLCKGKRFRNNIDKKLSDTIVELTTFKRGPLTKTNAASNNDGHEPENSEVSIVQGEKIQK